MKRWTGPAAAVALVAGVVSGTALHLGVDRAQSEPGTTTSATSTPTGTATATRSPATPTPKKSATKSKSTRSSSPTTSVPAFTQAALLSPDDFMTHGWGQTTQTAQGDGLPADDIVRCTGIDPAAAGRIAAYWATYQGTQTTAAEIVARYETTEAANFAAGYSFNNANQCDGVTKAHAIKADGITQGTWFSYQKDGVRSVIAAVLVEDRLLVFSMSSAQSDPAETTSVDQLLRQAGKRLV